MNILCLLCADVGALKSTWRYKNSHCKQIFLLNELKYLYSKINYFNIINMEVASMLAINNLLIEIIFTRFFSFISNLHPRFLAMLQISQEFFASIAHDISEVSLTVVNS